MGVRKWQQPTNTPTYNSWRSMRHRCLFSKNPHYRDMPVCLRWVDSYDEFYKDMGERPPGTSLDRIDGAKGYEPNNCRWATWREQENNKPDLTAVTHDGQTHTIGEWGFILGFKPSRMNTIYKRYSRYGALTYEELFTPTRLFSHRIARRANLCRKCKTTKSCKWREHGKLCNTCYHQAYRAALAKDATL